MARRRMGRLKTAKVPRKKKAKGPEIVDKCDKCGRPLGRTCARTSGSAICAGAEGIIAGEVAGKWSFFCNEFCANEYTIGISGRWIDGKLFH